MTDPLQGFPLLQDLGHNDRVVLREHLIERRLETGTLVFQAGTESDELLFVVEGRVRLELQGESLAMLGPGELLGALSLVAIGVRECSAVVEERARLLALTREGYLRLRSAHPNVALELQEAILRVFAGSVRTSLPEILRGAISAA